MPEAQVRGNPGDGGDETSDNFGQHARASTLGFAGLGLRLPLSEMRSLP